MGLSRDYMKCRFRVVRAAGICCYVHIHARILLLVGRLFGRRPSLAAEMRASSNQSAHG